jgi:prepilin-type N-terminal cleavage/methylation domain-containing protein
VKHGTAKAAGAARAASNSQRGMSLLECAAALALAAIVLASTTRVSQASATLVRRSRVVAETVDLARNLLEHELGAPCASPLECPPGYRCSVTRAPVTAVADRLTASVTRDDGEAAEELHTLAPAPSCGG